MAVDRLQLLPGEDVLVDVRPHWTFLSGPLVTSVLLVAAGVALDVGFPHSSVPLHWVEGVVVALPCLWLAVRVLRWRTTRLVLTSVRVVELWGVLSVQRAETGLSEVRSVTVVQSLVRRALGTGQLELEVEGEENARWIDDVRKPVILRRIINRRLPRWAPRGPGIGQAMSRDGRSTRHGSDRDTGTSQWSDLA